MNSFYKSILTFSAYIGIGLVCYFIFKEPTSFIGGFMGALAGDYVTSKYSKND